MVFRGGLIACQTGLIGSQVGLFALRGSRIACHGPRFVPRGGRFVSRGGLFGSREGRTVRLLRLGAAGAPDGGPHRGNQSRKPLGHKGYRDYT